LYSYESIYFVAELANQNWNKEEKKMYNRHYCSPTSVGFGWNYNRNLEIADFELQGNTIAEEGTIEYNNFFDITID
jgi:hypothetical protein